MTIPQIKKKMLEYQDFYGGDFINSDDIKNAKTLDDLKEITEKHRHFMENMLSDANAHLDNFKREIGIY